VFWNYEVKSCIVSIFLCILSIHSFLSLSHKVGCLHCKVTKVTVVCVTFWNSRGKGMKHNMLLVFEGRIKFWELSLVNLACGRGSLSKYWSRMNILQESFPRDNGGDSKIPLASVQRLCQREKNNLLKSQKYAT